MVYLRRAEQLDMDLLFAWANDPVVRKNSFKIEPIPYEDHKKWFEQVMMDDMVLLYIMMDHEDPVGQLRLNLDNYSAEIGYSISAEYRGKGYGHKILQLLYEEVREHQPEIRKLIAKVKPENTISKKLFESAGYRLISSSNPIDTMYEGECGLKYMADNKAILNIDIYERDISS